MRRPALLLALALLGAPATARAQTPPVYPSEEWHVPRSPQEYSQGTQSRWYGWQLLIADAIGDAAMTVAFLMRDDDVSEVAGTVFWTTQLTGPLIIHSAHDRPWRGAGMAFMRYALGIFGAFGAYCPRDDEDGYCLRAYVGFFVPVLVGQAIDVGIASWKTTRREWPQRPPPPRVSAVPTVMPVRGGAAVGVVGAF